MLGVVQNRQLQQHTKSRGARKCRIPKAVADRHPSTAHNDLACPNLTGRIQGVGLAHTFKSGSKPYKSSVLLNTMTLNPVTLLPVYPVLPIHLGGQTRT